MSGAVVSRTSTAATRGLLLMCAEISPRGARFRNTVRNAMSNEMPTDGQPGVSADVTAKEENVARANAAFSTSVRKASAAARLTVERAVSVPRAVVIGVGVLAGTFLVVRLLRDRSENALNARRTQSPPSRWRALARAATLALASAAGRRLCSALVRRERQTRRSQAANARTETQR
jgi:hypothetical protein